MNEYSMKDARERAARLAQGVERYARATKEAQQRERDQRNALTVHIARVAGFALGQVVAARTSASAKACEMRITGIRVTATERPHVYGLWLDGERVNKDGSASSISAYRVEHVNLNEKE